MTLFQSIRANYECNSTASGQRASLSLKTSISQSATARSVALRCDIRPGWPGQRRTHRCRGCVQRYQRQIAIHADRQQRDDTGSTGPRQCAQAVRNSATLRVGRFVNQRDSGSAAKYNGVEAAQMAAACHRGAGYARFNCSGRSTGDSEYRSGAA